MYFWPYFMDEIVKKEVVKKVWEIRLTHPPQNKIWILILIRVQIGVRVWNILSHFIPAELSGEEQTNSQETRDKRKRSKQANKKTAQLFAIMTGVNEVSVCPSNSRFRCKPWSASLHINNRTLKLIED